MSIEALIFEQFKAYRARMLAEGYRYGFAAFLARMELANTYGDLEPDV